MRLPIRLGTDLRRDKGEHPGRGHDLGDFNTLVDHWPDRDETRAVLDTGDACSLEMAGIGGCSNSVTGPDGWLGAGHPAVGADYTLDDRCLNRSCRLGWHVWLTWTLRDD